MIFNWFIRFYYHEKENFINLTKTKERKKFIRDIDYEKGYIDIERLNNFDLNEDKITDRSFIVEGFYGILGYHEFLRIKIKKN